MKTNFAITATLCLAAVLPHVIGCKKSEESQNAKPSGSFGKAGAAFGPDTSPIPPDISKGWCSGHGMPESVCTRCDDSLIEKFKAAGDWCKEHGLPETQCVKCHPEVKERWEKLKPGDQGPGAAPPGDEQHGALPAIPDTTAGAAAEPCEAHGIPKNVCARCNTTVVEAFKKAGDWCKKHGVPESQCTICNPEKLKARANEAVAVTQTTPPAPSQRNGNARRAGLPPSPTCTKSKSLVRLQSPEMARTAGLQFVSIEEQPLTATITRNAELVYNANRYARLSPRAAGVIVDVRRDLGDAALLGDVFAVVDSAELGSAKAEMLQTVAAIQLWKRSAERQRSLADRGIGTETEALESENKLAEAQINQARAKQRLRNLGLSDADIASVEESQDTSSHLQVAAPFEGIVVERSAVLGDVVEPTRVLFAMANTQLMWAMIDLFESDVPVVAAGQEVLFVLESVPGQTFPGKITWVSTHLNPSTRTLKARAEIANDSGLLRANTFGRVQIVVRRGERSLLVPKEAVQWDGCCNLVFVKSNDEGTAFQPKQVYLGIDTGTGYEVLSGVKNGDVLVTSGSYLLKTEILKGSIGAGCCDVVEKLTK